jgi:hypothetical protein
VLGFTHTLGQSRVATEGINNMINNKLIMNWKMANNKTNNKMIIMRRMVNNHTNKMANT